MIPDREEWVPALEAAKRLGPKFGGITRAQQAIALALYEGALRARADVCAYIDEDENFVEEEASPDDPIEIPADVWRSSDNWAADVMRWSWDGGWFEVKADDAEDDRVFIGVSFDRGSLEKLDPAMPIFAPMQGLKASPLAAKRGRKANVDKWGALIGALLELERENRLRAIDYPTLAPLLKTVRNAVDPDLWLEDRTLEGVLAYVWRNHLEELPPRH